MAEWWLHYKLDCTGVVAAAESLSAVEAETESDIVEFEYEIVVAAAVAAVAVFVEFGPEYAAVVFEGSFAELLFVVVAAAAAVEGDDEFVVELAGVGLFVEFEAVLGVDAAAVVVECAAVVAAAVGVAAIGRRSSPNGFGSTGAA